MYSPSDHMPDITEHNPMSTSSGRQEPAPQEVQFYYAGLVSKPRLLARSGTDSWPPTAPPFPPAPSQPYGTTRVPPAWTPETVRKHLGPIDGPFPETKHPIIAAWPEIRDEMIAVLAESPLQHAWSILFPTRITTKWKNRTGGTTSKVTVLVGASFTQVQEAASSANLSVWAVAMATVEKCQKVLLDRGFPSIDVEAYETEVFPLSGSQGSLNSLNSPNSPNSPGGSTDAKLAEIAPHDIEKYFDLNTANEAGRLCMDAIVHNSIVTIPGTFLHRPGQMLEQTKPASSNDSETYQSTGIAGSLGLYLGLGLKPASPALRSNKVLALTSRHVAIGENLDPNVPYSYTASQGGEDDMMMVLWGELNALQSGTEELTEKGREIVRFAEGTLKGWSASTRETDAEDPTDIVTTLYSYVRNTLEPLSEAMSAAAVNSYGSGNGDDQPRREVGHVVASARHGITQRQTWSDWALIELNESVAEGVLKRRPANQFFAGVDRASDFRDQVKRLHPNAFIIFRFLTDRHGVLRMGGTRLPGSITIPEDTSDTESKDKGKGKAPASANTDTDSDTTRLPTNSEFVFKNGAFTGFTMGLTNEVEAVVRMPLKDGRSVIAYNLLIYPTVTQTKTELSGRTTGRFSARGDSGSAVIGLDGCVVAMIDAGAGSAGLGRVFKRPPAVLPTADEDVEAQATAAHEAAKQGAVPLAFRPAKSDAIRGQEFRGDSCDVDVTLATPIDWVLNEIEATLGEPVHLV